MKLFLGQHLFTPLMAGLALLSLVSCDPAPTREELREMELQYLRCILPDELLTHASLEVAAKENLSIEEEDGGQYLALHLLEKNLKRSGGVRAEVSLDYPFKEGDTVRYAWRFRLADDFPTDAPANRWWLIGQWHDQPDTSKGESWDGFPSRSPPVLLGVGEKDGQLGMAVSYGRSQEKTSELMRLERGRWHHMAAVIRWSQKEDGQAVFYLDDMEQPAATLTGPNMHNGFQHYLKLGMYRHPEIATRNTIHVDDVQVRHVK